MTVLNVIVMKHQILLSLAANIQQKKNMAEARRLLSTLIDDAEFTPERWTKPIGNSRPDKYLNQLVRATTTLGADELQQRCKELERAMGRTDADRREGIVRIDIDLLQHDARRYHERDWERDYIRQLLPLFSS